MSIAQCKRNIRVAQVMSVQQPSTALSLTSAYNNVLSARCLRRIRQYLCPSIVQIETPQKFACCLESCGRCDAIYNQNVRSVKACLHKPTNQSPTDLPRQNRDVYHSLSPVEQARSKTYSAISVNLAFLEDSFDSAFKILKHRDDEI